MRNGNSALEQINVIIESQSVDTLKEMIVSLADDYTENADVIYPLLLNRLQAQLPEYDFVAFCAGLG